MAIFVSLLPFHRLKRQKFCMELFLPQHDLWDLEFRSWAAFFFLFAVLELELRTYALSHCASPFFVMGFSR
jgi:hypothetical protein